METDSASKVKTSIQRRSRPRLSPGRWMEGTTADPERPIFILIEKLMIQGL